MSFLRSPIKAGPVWPSVLTGIFSYQSITLFLCVLLLLLFFILIISNYSTTLSSGVDWWIIDKPPVF